MIVGIRPVASAAAKSRVLGQKINAAIADKDFKSAEAAADDDDVGALGAGWAFHGGCIHRGLSEAISWRR